VTGEAPATVLVSQQVPEVEVAAASTTPTGAFAELATGTHDANTSRPWPRAVLPQYSGNGTLAADYATAPSFYPFSPHEPHPVDSAEAPAPDASRAPPP
jgi:Meckel syndrome type 1 protein